MRGTYLKLLAGLALTLFAGVGATARLAAQTPYIEEKVNAELAKKRAEEARAARAKAERELAEAREEAAMLKMQWTKERKRAAQLEKEARARADQAEAAVKEALKEAERMHEDTQQRAQRAMRDAEAVLEKARRIGDPVLLDKLEQARREQPKPPQANAPAALEAMVKDLDQRAARLRQDYDKRRDALLAEVKALDSRMHTAMARLEDEKAAILAAHQGRAGTERAQPNPGVGDKLDRILDRLDRIEKRLDRLEKMPLRGVPRLPRQPADNPFFEKK
jgi:hypothetical protein